MKVIKEIKEEVLFHSHWNVGNPFTRKQELVIKSYLATQNLEKTRYILWSNIDLSTNEHVKPYLDKIELRIYDPIKESIGIYDYLLSRLMSLHNKNTIDGKKKIADELLPTISRIENEIVKEHYLALTEKFFDKLNKEFEDVRFRYKWECGGYCLDSEMHLISRDVYNYEYTNDMQDFDELYDENTNEYIFFKH